MFSNLQSLAFITGAIYFHGLREKLKSEDLEEEEGAGRTSRNKVAPIAVVREPSPTVSEPPHHREESKVGELTPHVHMLLIFLNEKLSRNKIC